MKEKEQHIYDNSEAGERQYQQKLKADQSMLQMFFSSFSQCLWVPFYYPYGYPIFPQTDLLVKQSEDDMNKD
ncbi:hypothetical protein QA584_08900 [Anaerocolumna sp. AGMB13025]|uniref:hypothetical protein n=1 Tax=Anaerocolumna sp. AGMB13025 TaxID=3039116 RepID=UPI00241F69D1|nr:hypothetical protein [Anaerocolumna sp. AGMB13025]WFR59186.1 hypothetical protein QA584_08900 [Anaerocolumna sp. AGMB13025]